VGVVIIVVGFSGETVAVKIDLQLQEILGIAPTRPLGQGAFPDTVKVFPPADTGKGSTGLPGQYRACKSQFGFTYLKVMVAFFCMTGS
jgi:hypothetical protein